MIPSFLFHHHDIFMRISLHMSAFPPGGEPPGFGVAYLREYLGGDLPFDDLMNGEPNVAHLLCEHLGIRYLYTLELGITDDDAGVSSGPKVPVHLFECASL